MIKFIREKQEIRRMIFRLTANEVNPSATQNLLKTLKKFSTARPRGSVDYDGNTSVELVLIFPSLVSLRL